MSQKKTWSHRSMCMQMQEKRVCALKSTTPVAINLQIYIISVHFSHIYFP